MKELIKGVGYELVGRISRNRNRREFPTLTDGSQIIVFDTSLGTENLGDYIIMNYCSEIIDNLYPDMDKIHISTHLLPDAQAVEMIKDTKYQFVCGTNLLTSHIEKWWNWILPDGFRQKRNFRNVILLGAGWGVYEDACSPYTRMIYRSMLNASMIHSVRDQYTENRLREAGISNVMNTGCPTMWRLTPEFCAEIPCVKAKHVITTVTDYRREYEADQKMLSILSKAYETVGIWIQGDSDEAYLKEMELDANVYLIPHTLAAYEESLQKESVDYVGTRLHAGIFALNHKIRSLIIAVDNRAKEIAKDTNLPILERTGIEEGLERWIYGEAPVDIKLNQKNIELFLEQFR